MWIHGGNVGPGRAPCSQSSSDQQNSLGESPGTPIEHSWAWIPLRPDGGMTTAEAVIVSGRRPSRARRRPLPEQIVNTVGLSYSSDT